MRIRRATITLTIATALAALSAPAVAHAATLQVGPGMTYTTISSAIAAASAGDIISIEATTYKEYLVIDKPLTIVGPNAGRTVGATRSAEATIMPPDADVSRDATAGNRITIPLIEVLADDVTIDGLYLAGDNPANATGDTLADGGTSEANAGVSSGWSGDTYGTGLTTERTTVRSCVIDGFLGYGVCFSKVLDATTSAWGHRVLDNDMRHIRVALDKYSGMYYPGIGVFSNYSAYYQAERNRIDALRGTYFERVEVDDGRSREFRPAVVENTITANIWGITLNPQTNWGTPGRSWRIERNSVDMSGGNYGWRPSVGILFSAMPDYWGTPTAPIVADNTLRGGDYGYYGYSLSATMNAPATASPAPTQSLTIQGGSVTSAGVGAMLTNVCYWWGEAAWIAASRMVIDSVEITGCGIGVQADDPPALPWPPSWGTGTFTDSTIPVRIDLVGTTRIHGCGTGAVARGTVGHVHSQCVATGCNHLPWQEVGTGTVSWTDTATPTSTVSPPSGTYPATLTVTMTATHPVGACPKTRYRVNGGEETTYTGPLKLGVPGTYTVSYQAFDEWGHVSASDTVTYVVVPATHTVTRVAGTDRYGTAGRTVPVGWPGYRGIRHVIVASGEDWAAADPLSAAGLAGVYDAPVLLARGDVRALPAPTVSALRAIAAANTGTVQVHLIGGTRALPSWVPTLIRATARYRFAVDRIGGVDRYGTAALIGYRMRAVLASRAETIPGVFVADGADPARFFDPLALGPIAYRRHMPILLVRRGIVPGVTRSAVTALAPVAADRFVGGPTVAVPETVRRSLGVPAGNRLAGADTGRYATAVGIANGAVARGWLPLTNAGVGNKLPDCLTGGTMMGRVGGPILYTEAAPLHWRTAGFLRGWKADIRTVYVLGGTRVVTDRTMLAIGAALR